MNTEHIITDEALAFLNQYINNPSPTGFEWKGQQLWLDYLRPYIDAYEVDNYGSVYGIINPDSDYKVVIEAHADEISWLVNYITEEGLIYVVRNGGSDQMLAPSKRVHIHTRDGRIVEGVFGWPAIHLRAASSDQAPQISQLFIDCGCSSKAEVLEKGVHVGCVITYPDEFMILNQDKFVGRALDNRIGGFMIAQVARLLRENNISLPYSLYIVNAVQEEVGLRGAQMVVQRIKPDVALVTDVGHDTTTPMIEKSKAGDYKIGKGPKIGFAPAVHNKLLDLMIQTARKEEIPFQFSTSSPATGTDTDAFVYNGAGVVSALISLPMRYMHTTVEMVHRNDVENVIKLLYYTLQNIQYKHNFKYL